MGDMTGAYNWHYLLFLSSKYIEKYVHNLYIVSNEIINAWKYKFKGNKVNSCFTFIAQSICMVTCFLWEPWNSSAWNLDASHGMHQKDMNIAQTILRMFWELNRVLPRRHSRTGKKKKRNILSRQMPWKEMQVYPYLWSTPV